MLREAGDGLHATLPDGSQRRVTVCWAGHGYPRDVERTLASEAVTNALAADDLVVFVAHSFSEGARRLLRSRGLSWTGLDGSAELRLGTVWVDRDGNGGRRVTRPPTIGWTRARADVAEALLAILAKRDHESPEALDVPEVEALATLAGRSLGTVANTFAFLDAQKWTVGSRRARSRALAQPTAFFDSWAAWDSEQHRRFDGFHSIHRDPARIVQELIGSFGTTLVLTGAAASELVRPTLTGGHVVTAYVETADGWPGIEASTRDAGMIPAAAPRVRLAPAPPVVARTTSVVDGSRVTSPARTYADMLAGSEREREAAEAYRASTLGWLA